MRGNRYELLEAGLAAAAVLIAVGCAGNRVDDRAGRPSVYEDPGSVSRTAGIGIESQDIVGMTDQMLRDMLATPVLADREVAPRVVPIPIGMPLDEVEQRLIDETLRQTKGDKELAAKLLGIASRTIYRKLKEREENPPGETG